VNKTAAAAPRPQLANCILLHAYSCITATTNCANTKKIHRSYLMSWLNNIFGYKKNRLRTIKAENP